MDEVLASLLRLDELDRGGAKRRRERQSFPGPEERQRLVDSLTAASAREKEVRERLAGGRSSFRQLELDLRATEERLAADEKRLYSGEVGNPKELTRLEHRVAEERHRREELEERYLSLMEVLEEAERDLARAREEAKLAEEALAAFDREQERLAEADAIHEREYAAAREVLLERLPGPLKERYERIQSRYPGAAVARIEGGSCNGCHTALSQAEVERALRTPGQTTCENCGRLLVPSEMAGRMEED